MLMSKESMMKSIIAIILCLSLISPAFGRESKKRSQSKSPPQSKQTQNRSRSKKSAPRQQKQRRAPSKKTAPKRASSKTPRQNKRSSKAVSRSSRSKKSSTRSSNQTPKSRKKADSSRKRTAKSHRNQNSTTARTQTTAPQTSHNRVKTSRRTEYKRSVTKRRAPFSKSRIHLKKNSRSKTEPVTVSKSTHRKVVIGGDSEKNTNTIRNRNSANQQKDTNRRKRVMITADKTLEYRGNKLVRYSNSSKQTARKTKSISRQIHQPSKSGSDTEETVKTTIIRQSKTVKRTPLPGRKYNSIQKTGPNHDTTPATPSVLPATKTLLNTSETSTSPIKIVGNNNVIINGDLSGYPYVSKAHSSTLFHPHHRCHRKRRSSLFSFNYGFSMGWNWHHDNWYFGSYHYRPSRCGRVTYYSYGPYYGVSYIYPRYHRRYVFFSIGGYWPKHYRYRRYYRYGCHPHRWYGRNPVEYTVENNYYTYHYYGSSASGTEPTYSYDTSGNVIPDYDGLSRIRQRNEQIQSIETPEPEPESPADIYFDEGVGAFQTGEYDDAVLKFREAIRLSPEDMVLPFAYCQALFANKDYSRAASVLRSALLNLEEDTETVFFPRGLYEKDETLIEQIEMLERVAAIEPYNSDLQLLLGYQWLGLGQTDKAALKLLYANENNSNKKAVDILQDLLEQIEEIGNSSSEKQ